MKQRRFDNYTFIVCAALFAFFCIAQLDAAAQIPLPTFSPTKLPGIFPSSTPTPVVIITYDYSAPVLQLGASVISASPATDAVLPVTMIIERTSTTTPTDVNVQFNLHGSDGAIDASWTETITAAQLADISNVISLQLSLSSFTPLDVDTYTLVAQIDPMGILPEINRSNNMIGSAAQGLLQTTGVLWFDGIETTLLRSAISSVSPLRIIGRTSYFGVPAVFTNLEVHRDPGTLDLTVISGTATFSNRSNHQRDGWTYDLKSGILNSSGASADAYVYLPQTISHRLGSSSGTTYRTVPISLGRQSLDSVIKLASSSIAMTDSISLYIEGLPFYVADSTFAFEPANGLVLSAAKSEYIHAARFRVAPGERASNDGLFNNNLKSLGTATVTPEGLQGGFGGSARSYMPAFPLASTVAHGSTHVEISNSVINGASSYVDTLEVEITVETQGCDPAADSTLTFAINGSPAISGDGSVAHYGALSSAYPLAFNTYTGDAVSNAAWYQPGFQLRADAPPASLHKVGQYLLAGRSASSERLYYKDSSEFNAGDGYYAGVNLMPGDLNTLNATAQIASDSLDLILNEGSKLYIRRGGFSGTFDADLSGDGSLEIYPDAACPGDGGYDITLTSFGQAYIDNDSEGYDTKIAGQVDLPYPSLIDIPFEDMTINSCGNFTEGKIPEDEQNQVRTLAYWLADLTLSTLSFELKDGAASDDERTLWTSSVNDVDGLDVEPLMQINFLPCGTIGDSNVAEPVQTALDGYETTVETLYLTAWDGGASANGFYSLVTSLDVPFFDPPRVHSQIRPSSHRLATGSPWDDDDSADADADGWPDGYSPSGSSLSEQFVNYANERLITMETQLGGVINLGYEVKYDPGATTFESSEPLEQDLIILDMNSHVDYINQERAKLLFGLSIDGFDGLNFSSATDSFGDAVQEKFFDAVRDKLDELDDELTGDLSNVLRPLLYDLIQPHVDTAVGSIQDLIEDLPVDEAEALLDADVPSELTVMLSDIDLVSQFATAGDIRDEIVAKIDVVIETLETVSDNMNLSVDDIEGMAGDLVDVALIALSLTSDIDVDQVLGDVEALQQELTAPLDEVIDALNQAKSVLQDPLTFDLIFTTPRISGVIADIQSELETYFDALSIEQVQTLDSGDLTNMILDAIFNSQMFQEANQEVANWLMPIKEMLYEQAIALLDELNRVVTDFIEESAGSLLEGVDGAFKDVSGFKGADMQGYAVIAGDNLETLHIDASLELEVPDAMTFSGYIDITRYEVENSGKTCFDNLDAEAALDIRIGANDIDLSWTGADLSADIEFAMMLADAKLVNVGGSIVTEGTIDFETVSFSDLGFGLAVGQVENYLWAKGSGRFNTYEIEGGIFLGTSCSLEPLEILDPEVASLLTIDEMRGVFAKFGASFPIYNYGCVLRIAAEAEIAAWYFAEGPTYGGKLVAGAYGEGLCVVSVKGEVTLIGGREGSNYYFNGHAWVAGGIGDCEPEDWDTLNDAYSDKWCYACGASVDLTYKQEQWDVEYDAGCN
ncbi:MAG: hypothetical protein P9L94_15375 [Candidatus Hinthialibacter antarcticus]|nr:hypothetical protein [Candidatus Hinthialibacter antarcticus]